MPKTDDTFDPADYTPVAERIVRFYAAHPTGRIITRPRRVSERMVLFEARVYRCAGDRHAAATGFASERPGDGDINTVACVENTETSAIGRALANLGILAGRQRPSREEMVKAERARRSPTTSVNLPFESPDAVRSARDLPTRAPARRAPTAATSGDFEELVELLADAERSGYPDVHAAQIRDLVRRGVGGPQTGSCASAEPGSSTDAPDGSPAYDRDRATPEPVMLGTVRRAQRQLRDWIERHGAG